MAGRRRIVLLQNALSVAACVEGFCLDLCAVKVSEGGECADGVTDQFANGLDQSKCVGLELGPDTASIGGDPIDQIVTLADHQIIVITTKTSGKLASEVDHLIFTFSTIQFGVAAKGNKQIITFVSVDPMVGPAGKNRIIA